MCDRTLEYLELVQSKGATAAKAAPEARQQPKTRSAFYEATAEIGGGIQSASQMLSQLSKLVRRQGLFDDSSQDIDTMIFKIKQQLTELNSKCDNAQTFVDNKKNKNSSSSSNTTQQVVSHNGTVVNQLKSDLMIATKDFKSILEMRSTKMKDQNKRKTELTGNGLLSPIRQLNAAAQQHKRAIQAGGSKALMGKKPYNPYAELAKQQNLSPYDNPASSSSSSSSSKSSSSSSSGGFVDVEQQQGSESEGSEASPLLQNALLVAPPSVETQYYDSRERAVTEVERTIVELGGIFHRLSSMISEQDELVERIDEDVENAVTDTNNARDYLLSVYNSVSSNRGMYMKLTAIFVIFIIFFTLFLM